MFFSISSCFVGLLLSLRAKVSFRFTLLANEPAHNFNKECVKTGVQTTTDENYFVGTKVTLWLQPDIYKISRSLFQARHIKSAKGHILLIRLGLWERFQY